MEIYHKNANKEQKMCPLCPLVDPTMPVAWASTAHQVGIHRTSAGQQVPVLRALVAQKTRSILGNTDKGLLFTIVAFCLGTFCLEQWRKELFRCAAGEEKLIGSSRKVNSLMGFGRKLANMSELKHKKFADGMKCLVKKK